MRRSSVTVPEIDIQPLSSERSLYMREAAGQALDVLQRFSADLVEFGPTALQLLDEWIDRMERRGPLSNTSRALVVAFLGHTFLQEHGGYWATETRGRKQRLGVICPVAGSGNQTQFIDIVEQVNRRLANGISDSLAFFYLVTSVELRGRL
jgi:hypothetical protein